MAESAMGAAITVETQRATARAPCASASLCYKVAYTVVCSVFPDPERTPEQHIRSSTPTLKRITPYSPAKTPARSCASSASQHHQARLQ